MKLNTGIPRFLDCECGDTKETAESKNLCKSRLLSNTKGEENRIEL